MAIKPVVCGQSPIYIPECDPDLEARVEALEECCDEAQGALEEHDSRISTAEQDIDNIEEIVNEHTQSIQDLDSGKQDKLIAGNNIEISGSTISADVQDYTAGDGIDITDGVISADAYTGTGKISVSNTKEISVDLTDYYTKDHLYTKDEIDALMADGFSFVPVSTLPATGETSKIYLLETADPNNRDMYIWYENAWEKVGSTGVDLDGYVKTTGARETYDEHRITVWLPDSSVRRLTILGIGWEAANGITSGDGYDSGSPGADTGGSVTP